MPWFQKAAPNSNLPSRPGGRFAPSLNTVHMTVRRHAKAAERPRALAPEHTLMVQTLAHQFYVVVPREYRTYCAFTARIAMAALRGLGVDADLLACQMWCVTPKDNYVVGFLDRVSPEKGRWNGHVVCVAGDFFIDAAVCNFERDFQLRVPTVVYGQRFRDSTTVVARVNIAASSQLWWHSPPPGVNTTVPDAPEKSVADFAAKLMVQVRAVLSASQPSGALMSPLAIVTRPSVDDRHTIPPGTRAVPTGLNPAAGHPAI